MERGRSFHPRALSQRLPPSPWPAREHQLRGRVEIKECHAGRADHGEDQPAAQDL